MITLAQIDIIASAGLIKRARKALLHQNIQWTHASDNIYHFTFEDNQGQLNTNTLGKSLCSCPAKTMCKHIIAAAISHIENNGSPNSTQFKPPDFKPSKLFIEAGKAATRSAFMFFKQLNSGTSVKIESTHCQVSWQDKSAIILDSNQLDSIVVIDDKIESKLIAALLLLKSQKQSIHWPNWLLEESNQQTQNRAQLITQVKIELTKLASIGVKHLQQANSVKLLNLIPKLKKIKEYQISNNILKLQSEIKLKITNQGAASLANIQYQLSSLYALCEGNQHHYLSKKTEFHSLSLLCIGGHISSVISGVLGIKLIFLSNTGQIYHASFLRRQENDNHNLLETWRSQSLRDDFPLLANMPGQYSRLDSVSINQFGTISLKKTTTHSSNLELLFDILAVCDWKCLTQIKKYQYILIKPNQWLSCEFDELNQQLILQLQDESENILVVQQRYTHETANRISNVLALWHQSPKYLLIHHTLYNNTHQFEPISLFDNTWISLDFYQSKELIKSLQPIKTSSHDQLNHNNVVSENTGIIALLKRIENELQEYPFIDDESLDSFADIFKQFGLDGLAEMISNIKSNHACYLKVVYMINTMSLLGAPWPLKTSKI